MTLEGLVVIALLVGPIVGVAQAWIGPPFTRRLAIGGAVGGAAVGAIGAIGLLAASPHIPISLRLVALPILLAAFGGALGSGVAFARRAAASR